MYVRFTSSIYTLLMPVAQPTARVHRPLALEDLGLLPSSWTL
jgi:hypothetical protein